MATMFGTPRESVGVVITCPLCGEKLQAELGKNVRSETQSEKEIILTICLRVPHVCEKWSETDGS